MTAPRNPDRLIRAFLAEGQDELPDQVYDAVRDRIEQTNQRVVIGPWRTPFMNKFVAIGLGAAAVVVALLIGAQRVGQPTVVGPPTEAPSPTSAPSVAPSGAVQPAGFGLLDAGTYSVTAVEPPFTFTVPDGWSYGRGLSVGIQIVPAALEASGALILVCNNTAAVDAANNEVPGVETDAESIVAHVAGRSDLRNMGEPQSAAIGGIDGWFVDFDGPERPAPETPGDVAVVGPLCGINAYDQQVTRLGVFDVPGGDNVLIVIASPPGDRSVIDAGTSIVETFVFDLP